MQVREPAAELQKCAEAETNLREMAGGGREARRAAKGRGAVAGEEKKTPHVHRRGCEGDAGATLSHSAQTKLQRDLESCGRPELGQGSGEGVVLQPATEGEESA